ncbi:MAG: hypothetical protein V1754_04805 [Pseudomonadota bacterium]
MKTGTKLFAALLVSSLAGACTFKTLNELQRQTPVVDIEQQGFISSNTFGDHLVAFGPWNGEEGATLFVSSNSSAALHTINFTNTGEPKSNPISPQELGLLEDLPDTIHDLALASNKTTKEAFAYIAGSESGKGKIPVVNIRTFKEASSIDPPDDTSEFASSIVGAKLAGEVANDIAIGAEGKVILKKNKGGEFDFYGPILVVGGVDWPTEYVFSTLAAGNLDRTTDEDEVVMAAPKRDYVAIVHHIDEDKPSTTKEKYCNPNNGCSLKVLIHVPAPKGEIRFGSALLIAEKLGSDENVLVIGAPGANDGKGAVYYYKLTDKNFDLDENGNFDGDEIPDPKIISAPDGAKGFGSSLALGKFDNTETQFLAIGAPNSEVDGFDKAGKIYLYKTSELQNAPNDPINEIALLKTKNDMNFGRNLVKLPFTVDEKVYDLLVTSTTKAIYAFFDGLTKDHKDKRKR